VCAEQGNADQVELYCIGVVGTVTRVIDSQLSEGIDQIKFYGTRVSFPLHDRGEAELLGLDMQLSVFMSSASPTDSDREVGECTVELARNWLFGTEGHTTWLKLLHGAGGGSAGRVKVSILPEFGRGTVMQQEESLLHSRNESHLQNTLLDLSQVRACSPSPLTASSDEDDTILTDRSHMPFPPGYPPPMSLTTVDLFASLLVVLDIVVAFNTAICLSRPTRTHIRT